LIADNRWGSTRLWGINLGEKTGKMTYQPNKKKMTAKKLSGDSKLFTLAGKVY